MNGNNYSYPYWLGDGIYPRLATFVQAFAKPSTEIDKNFSSWQEAARKDIERAFGVLQARWAILARPARHWDKTFLDDIVTCCVILHNMIVEDENGLPTGEQEMEFDDYNGEIVTPDYSIKVEESKIDASLSPFATVLERMRDNHNTEVHGRLQEDLKHHLFQNFPHYKNQDGM